MSLSPQRPTLADVARTAGVSVSTASLAFSGAGPIAEATRARVLAAATALDYAGPNPLGRQLRSGKSRIVGVLLGQALSRSFREPVAVQTLDGLVSTLAPLGLGVLLVPSSSQDKDCAHGTLAATAAMDVAVLLWGANLDDSDLTTLLRRGIPVINVEGHHIDGLPDISIEDRSGFAELGTYLRGLGHTRIATVTLPLECDGVSGFADADRQSGATLDLARRRLAGLRDGGVEPVAVFETPGSLVEYGAVAGRALLQLAEPPTAIVAQSDLLASGVVLAARELGLRVPQDVSVTGFDGIDLPWISPDVLTTITQPLADKGAAIGHAIEAILAGEVPESVMIDVDMRIGTTTGPPAAS